MPLYTYRCGLCSAKTSAFRKIAERDRLPACTKCKVVARMERMIEAPMVRGDYPGYDCPITGKWIEGKRAHEENLKLHDCRVLEEGETAARIAARQREEAEWEASLDATLEEEIIKLPSEKRDQLAAEAENGLTLEVVRTTPTV